MIRRRPAAAVMSVGVRLLRRERTVAGLRILEAGIAMDPAPPRWALARAARARAEEGDVAGAERWYRTIRERFPLRPDGPVGLARCAEAEEDWSGAAARWAEAIALAGADVPPRWVARRQLCLHRSDDGDTARDELRRRAADDERMARYLDVTRNTGGGASRLRFDHVLIVTYGRSGSTLLQGVLNSIDGVLVRGENGNLLLDLYRLRRHAQAVQERYGAQLTPDRPWFGAAELHPAQLVADLRPVARRLLLGSEPDDGRITCLGFKEIRYDELGDDLEGYLDFLRELLPNCAVILNTRDHAETARSGWWADRPGAEIRHELAGIERRLVAYVRALPSGHVVRYEDVVRAGPGLRALFDFLGARWDEDRVRAVLAVPHSFHMAPADDAAGEPPRGPSRARRHARRVRAVLRRVRALLRRVRRSAAGPAARRRLRGLERTRDLERRGRPADALAESLGLVARWPNDVQVAVTASRLLAAWERWEEAAAVLDRLPEGVRARPVVQHQYVINDLGRMDPVAALERTERLLVDDPDSVELIRLHIACLTDLGRLDEVEKRIAHIRSVRPTADTSPDELRLLNARFQLEDCWRIVDARLRQRPEDRQRRTTWCLERLRRAQLAVVDDAEWDDRADAVLRTLLEDAADQPAVQRVAVEVDVLREDVDGVERRLATLPPDWRHPWLIEARSWVAMRRGEDMRAVRASWSALMRQHPLPQVREPGPGELRAVGGDPAPSDPGTITLFTVVRNEADRIPWFLDHYRGLGVERFVVVDNGSTDATAALLDVAPDVVRFHTDVSYARARSGAVWLNHLIDTLGADGWNLYVDVDEALVFPGCESIGLRGLVHHLEAHDEEVMVGHMIDMFADPDEEVDWVEATRDFVAGYPYFNDSFRRTTKSACPYAAVRGGVRNELGLIPELTKTPLIRGGRGIHLLSSSHRVAPARVSGVTCALLHYKLVGDYRRTFARDVVENDRVPACRRRHVGYLAALDALGTDRPTLRNDTTVRYASSRTLQDRGIITSPDGFPS